MVEPHPAVSALPRPPSHDLAFEGCHHRDAAIRIDLDVDGAGFEVGSGPQSPDATRRQRFEPHALPDACGRRVEDRLRDRLPVLLAARGGLVGQRILGLHDEHVVAVAQGSRDLGAERGVAAFVTGHLDVVDPHGRPVVDRPEMQDDDLGRGRIEAPPVPDHVPGQLADARQLGLGAERNQDAPVEDRIRPGAELPLPVQGQPFRPPEGRPGVLGSGPYDRENLPSRRTGSRGP